MKPSAQQKKDMQEFARLITSNMLFLRVLLEGQEETIAEYIADVFLSESRGADILNYCIVSEMSQNSILPAPTQYEYAHNMI